MNTLLRRGFRIAALTIVAAFGFHSSVIPAQSQRLGVITVKFAMQAGGSGQWSWGDATIAGANGADDLAVSISGEAGFELVRENGVLTIGRRVSSSYSQRSYGTFSQHQWDFTQIPAMNDSISETLVSDPNATFSDAAALLVFDENRQGRILGRCRKTSVGVMSNGVFMPLDWPFDKASWPPEPMDGFAGRRATIRAEDQVADFQFDIVDPNVPFLETVTTPATVPLDLAVGAGGYDKGSAEASCTVSYQYIPDSTAVAFDANPLTGEAPLTVQFTSRNTDTGGYIVQSIRWNFGDGTTSELANPTHTYETPGVYPVTVTATNSEGANVKTVGPAYITVNLPSGETNRVGVIKLSYSMHVSGSGDNTWYGGPDCEGLFYSNAAELSQNVEANFELVKTKDTLSISKLIRSTASQTASGNETGHGSCHPYQAGGIDPFSYDRPFVSDPSFTPDQPVTFLKAQQGVPNHFVGEFERVLFGNYFGDTFYLYDDDQGSNTNGWWDVTIPSPWEIEVLGAWCATIVEDQVRHFSFDIVDANQAWTETMTTNGTYSWLQDNTQHHNTSDAAGSRTLTIEYVPENSTLPFTVSPTNGLLPLKVEFFSAAVDSGSSAIQSRIWNFGDGATSDVQNPTHTYTNVGRFFVSLLAVNVNGTEVHGVGASNIFVVMPKLEFAAFPTNGWMPLVVQFKCPPTDSGGNAILSWNWDFGDGVGSYFQNPQHAYVFTKSKTFTPKLRATNIWGTPLIATGPKISAVYPPIVFTAAPTNSLVPMLVRFSAPSTDAFNVRITKWKWDFGDGVISSEQNPTHVYTNTQIFEVTLIATNANGAVMPGLGPNISAGCRSAYTFGAGGYGSGGGGFTNAGGAHPQAGLAFDGSRFYGVMMSGGSGGAGTVFSAAPEGNDLLSLHDFTPLAIGWYTNADGASPKTRLCLDGNTLYGSTAMGGLQGMSMGGGTIFKVNTDGAAFSALHHFASWGPGGNTPSGVILVKNTLYGAAARGGANFTGLIFKMNTDGSGFAPIYHFSATQWNPAIQDSTNADGSVPVCALIADESVAPPVLYGAASSGGAAGAGTVFKLALDGSGFTVLHHFDKTDGASPLGTLCLSDGSLFGTTRSGGPGNKGSVFSVTADGYYTTLHSFSATQFDPDTGRNINSDGAEPAGGLLVRDRVLYGATTSGGLGGSGTIFSLNIDTVSFTNLYSFSPLTYSGDALAWTNLDGANPYGEVLWQNNALYTTTCNGGANGSGTLFSLNLEPAKPLLNVEFGTGFVVLSWFDPENRCSLQQNADIADSSGWTDLSLEQWESSDIHTAQLPVEARNLFFRLVKPQ